MPTGRPRGFTLVELMVALVCIALIASVAMPFTELVVQRRKEADLRTSLREIRTALDAWKQAAEEGRIRRTAGESGFPPDLALLVEGVQDQTRPDGQKIRFLRRIPRDPFHPDPATPAIETWGKRSYDSSPRSPREGKDVFDVYSRAPGNGLNGVPYRDW